MANSSTPSARGRGGAAEAMVASVRMAGGSSQFLHDALDEMLTSDGGILPVVDREGAFLGVVNLDTIMAAVRAVRSGAGAPVP